MAFLRRDFAHTEFSSWRKRERALTKFYNASGQLVAAYSYNTALAVVLPSDDHAGGVRIYLNTTTYSKGTTEHADTVGCELINAYGHAAHRAAADAFNVPVGISADELAACCREGGHGLPSYVRERAVPGRVHLTRADHRRYFGPDKVGGSQTGRDMFFACKTRDGETYFVRVTDGITDIDEDDDSDYTLSPDFYTFLITTQAKAAAVAEARGSLMRHNGYRSHVDLTYSKRPA